MTLQDPSKIMEAEAFGTFTMKSCHDVHISIHSDLCKGTQPTFCCRFPGAEDVVMAFSRSETEDRRQ